MEVRQCSLLCIGKRKSLLLTQEWGLRGKVRIRPRIAMAEEDA